MVRRWLGPSVISAPVASSNRPARAGQQFCIRVKPVLKVLTNAPQRLEMPSEEAEIPVGVWGLRRSDPKTKGSVLNSVPNYARMVGIIEHARRGTENRGVHSISNHADFKTRKLIVKADEVRNAQLGVFSILPHVKAVAEALLGRVRIPAKPIGYSGRCRSPVPARRSPGA